MLQKEEYPSMKLNVLTSFLETIAPSSYQEDYDNSGLIVGDLNKEISKALISLDCTEAVIDEAILRGCNVVISHHPIVFKGLKRLNGNTYIERVVMKAIKHDIAIYAIHTNLDHVQQGVNAKICDKLGIRNRKILLPKQGLIKKLVTYCPTARAEEVREALFAAGAGNIGNYSDCSYNSEGYGTFRGNEGTNSFVGEPGIQHREAEVRIETVYPAHLERKVLIALFESHPYEEVAYDTISLNNPHLQVGAGMIGWLDHEMDAHEFLMQVKYQMHTKVIRHTKLLQKRIKRVAVCGGSGSFLLKQAISAGADVFITADYKYHEFFDAEDKIIIADIGHFESEQFTQELLLEIIRKNFPNFALHLTECNTNPINYLI